MSCRQIIPVHNNEWVKKIVPLDNNFQYPSLEQYVEEEWVLEDFINSHNLNDREATMLQQQYSEYLIWNTIWEGARKYLAPIFFAEQHTQGPPILYYPRFTPLANTEEVWKLNDQQSLVLLGARSTQFGIDAREVDDLIKCVDDLEEYYDVTKEDIIYNPSNIGYHPEYGLRIIDYGLRGW